MNNDYPKLVLAEWFDDRFAFELPFKGYFYAEVELENGSLYELTFYDPIRLNQELTDNTALGKPCFVEQNLIIVEKVTLETITISIQHLWNIGYFDNLKPKK